MIRAPGLIAVALLASAGSTQEHDHGAAAPEKLGTVHFATSCSAGAQPRIDRAVALLHSFDFQRAIDGFNAALAADPRCGIAEWGIALSLWTNPFAPGIKPLTLLRQASDAVQRGQTIGASTERERRYIDAVGTLYADFDRTSQSARLIAYRDAMDALASRFPDDVEATIFYALALAAAADPADKTYASQLKGGALLDRLFAKYPDHPGLAHYIIHTYDVPPLADRALEAARRYARIAPSAPHAQHMPSHTFTRVGYWQESIDANIAAAASARREGATPEELHASDYQTYAYLQTGRDRAAATILASLPEMASRFDPTALTAGSGPPVAAYFALAAIPARYALERGAWTEAAALELRATPFPYVDAMTYFARGVGSARAGDAPGARAAADALAPLRDRLLGSGEPYWADQLEIQRLGVLAWLALVEGRQADALTQMRAAANREDATEKSAVTPGPLAPARELLADMLIAIEQPAAALHEYEAVLRKEPNRFRAVYGAAHAAVRSGDRVKGRKYFQLLLKICARADKPGRRELAEARRALSTARSTRR